MSEHEKQEQINAKTEQSLLATPIAHLRDPNEDNLALAFAEKYKNVLRFDHTRGLWYENIKTHWKEERTLKAFCWARDLIREINKTHNKNELTKVRTAAAVEKAARSDRRFAIIADDWNIDPYLLCTPGGTVELKTGQLRENRPEDHINKCTFVSPQDVPTPLWTKFLNQVTQGDTDLQGFLQQIAGYSLTGDIREHALFFVYGPGGNGKTVFANVIARILGDHHCSASMDTFVTSKYSSHPTELAWLHGARLVTASETDEGRSWAESRIKQLTGGDPIAARYMRQDFFQYQPQFKLMFLGNHKPTIQNPDDAMRRRFHIIPFNFKPPEVDKQLSEKLELEYPGILQWMIRGCTDWQNNGLIVPESVRRETDNYFADQDTFKQWLDECTEINTGSIGESASALWDSWKKYTMRSGIDAKTQPEFKTKMVNAGFIYKDRLPGIRTRGYLGISLKAPNDDYKPYKD